MVQSKKKHRNAVLLCQAVAPVGSAGNLLEHFQANFAIGDFAQGCNGRLIAAFNFGSMALAQHACAVSSRQHELEAIGDLLQAVFNSDACHQGSPRKSGEVERFKGASPSAALGRVLEALGVHNGF
jgi:hypothetical protein